jgi:outer membrane protein W
LGARYLIELNKQCKPKLFPYLGAGAGYYMVKEENPISTFDKKSFGFFIEGGLRFYLVGSFFIDAKIKDVFLKVKNDQGRNINTGGFTYMGAIGISF